MKPPVYSVSIVSHNHAQVIHELLLDLDRIGIEGLEVCLTLNKPEAVAFSARDFSFPLTIIKNPVPKGFAENHNHAFTQTTGRYFCVLNPDVRLDRDVCTPLAALLESEDVGVVAPLVRDASGCVEDSARRFPTPWGILWRKMMGADGPDYSTASPLIHPDWVAGMFMLFKRGTFQRLAGFDSRYFLYLEDVDLCARVRLLGMEIILATEVSITHHARRMSRKRLKYFFWHLRSMMRFFLSPVFFALLFRRAKKRGQQDGGDGAQE